MSVSLTFPVDSESVSTRLSLLSVTSAYDRHGEIATPYLTKTKSVYKGVCTKVCVYKEVYDGGARHSVRYGVTV